MKLIAYIAGKFAKQKLDLKEPEKMEDKKKWWTSKGVWTGVTIALIGTYDLVRINVLPQFGVIVPEIPGWLLTFLGATGIYTRVTADKKIG